MLVFNGCILNSPQTLLFKEVEGTLVTFVTCNYRYEYQKLQFGTCIQSGFKMLPTNNSYYSSTSYPHRSSHLRRVRAGQRGAGREPPLKNVRGGASAARSSGPQSLLPATPELAPGPWDPVRVLATDAAAPLFIPPALSLIHPTLYLPASIFTLLTPARNPASLLAAPPSLSPP
jgi:hypothetical protein